MDKILRVSLYIFAVFLPIRRGENELRTTGILGLAKGGPQEILQIFRKNLKLVIVKNLSCHQNNDFRSIKTCFKKFWSNAKGGPQGYLGLAKGDHRKFFKNSKTFKKPLKLVQTFLKIVKNLSCHQNNYFRWIKTCFKNFWSNAKGVTTGNFEKYQKGTQGKSASTHSKLSEKFRQQWTIHQLTKLWWNFCLG